MLRYSISSATRLQGAPFSKFSPCHYCRCRKLSRSKRSPFPKTSNSLRFPKFLPHSIWAECLVFEVEGIGFSRRLKVANGACAEERYTAPTCQSTISWSTILGQSQRASKSWRTGINTSVRLRGHCGSWRLQVKPSGESMPPLALEVPHGCKVPVNVVC